MGQHRYLGCTLAGLDVSPGSAGRGTVFQSAPPDVSKPGHFPPRDRADVSVHIARFSGPVPLIGTRTRRARSVTRGGLCAAGPPAAADRTRVIAALARGLRSL